jgi:hypothetical protein
VLQRVENEESDDGEPLYVLFNPNGQLKLYNGNDALADAAMDMRASAGAGASITPTRVILMGDGHEKDFDATRLTLEVSTGDGGGGDIIGPTRPTSFEFEPPDGSLPPGSDNVYRGGHWENLRVAHDTRGNLNSTQPFFDRGSVTVISRTAALLARLTATVRGVIRSKPQLAVASHQQIIEQLRGSLRQEVQRAKAEVPTLAAREGSVPEVLFRLDKSTYRQTLADIPSSPDPDFRLAANTNER